MAWPDFAINAVTMTAQPTDVDYIPAQPAIDNAINGGAVAHARSLGGRVRVTWGVDRLPGNAVLSELRTKRNSLLEHTLTWTDPAGASFDVDVIWPADPGYGIRYPSQYDRLSIEFLERAG